MFDIRELPVNSYGEIEHERVHDYINGLIVEFSDSPEAQPIVKRGEYLRWAGMMLDYAFNHLGMCPIDMSVPDFSEVVFDLFPRKVSTEAESAPSIIEELIAFWTFLKRQYELPSAEAILATLNDDAVLRLREELADPGNWGMAKSLFMTGKEAGFDMTTQDRSLAFMSYYNRFLARPMGGPAGPGFSGRTPRERHEQRKKERKRQRQAQKRSRR